MSKNKKDTPLSGAQIKNLMGEINERANIKLDSDISPSTTVNDIFGDSGHVILFHEWPNENVGHWYCMVRHHDKLKNGQYNKNGEIYFFDSFGKDPDTYQRNIKKAVSNNYDEMYMNDIPFQPADSNACGRYCLLVCALNKIGLTPDQIEEVMQTVDIDKFVIDKVR